MENPTLMLRNGEIESIKISGNSPMLDFSLVLQTGSRSPNLHSPEKTQV
jgi:hypothetical protein